MESKKHVFDLGGNARSDCSLPQQKYLYVKSWMYSKHSKQRLSPQLERCRIFFSPSKRSRLNKENCDFLFCWSYYIRLTLHTPENCMKMWGFKCYPKIQKFPEKTCLEVMFLLKFLNLGTKIVLIVHINSTYQLREHHLRVEVPFVWTVKIFQITFIFLKKLNAKIRKGNCFSCQNHLAAKPCSPRKIEQAN